MSICPTCGKVDTDEPTPLAQFLGKQDYAIMELANVRFHDDKMYWQGVKDGLRQAYALFTTELSWAKLCESSNGPRPDGAWMEDFVNDAN